ncbi:molybdopterin molybdotransferase MoeA [Chitiniphilus eburneus]|uniref:Molybdopterin molybdenumtransferase n=1 Tax=Chitiniphilus eburneus TaxID=2571148 RepID=A0A4U0PGZ7_9NEIS|nr:gephyrin-like molybdotransferase Glp [Chitiniphilus eburneus]TJZ66382.1 molybdopterin molybdotransferase MoeA [Chitiniphilus eburneus]
MHSLETMLDLLRQQPLPPPRLEMAPLHRLPGRVSAQTVRAGHDLPAFDASAMDGYAIAATPERPLGPYTLMGCVAAGAPDGGVLEPGQAMRVLTGAPLPRGCHGVVAQEHARLEADGVVLAAPLCYGAHMRLRGSELMRGERLVAEGERLKALHIGLLAAQGLSALQVYARPRVGVLSTGDELRAPGETLAPGQIYDANRPQLLALLDSVGAEAVDLGSVADDPAATRARLREATEVCDLILSSGGASVGDADHIRDAVDALGSISHWQVAIKPGKPFAFGHVLGRPFVALPGNPVAAAITFLLLARPLVRRAGGEAVAPQEAVAYPLLDAADNPGPRRHFLRGRFVDLDGVRHVEPFEQQGSAALATLASAEVLLELPAQARLAAGNRVRCHPLTTLGLR